MSGRVVLLSGGIDSTTCLAISENKKAMSSVALNIYYGQRHAKEIKAARAVAEWYGVPYYELDLSGVMAQSNCSLLSHSTEKVQHGSYSEQMKEREGKPVSTYVPFRNGLFLSAAAAWALSIGADEIMYGAHADDAAGNAYPDCSVKFVQKMGDAILEGTAGRVELVAPLILLNKAQVVRCGLELGAPYHLTWSCYEGGDKPCGKCGTCIDRELAFRANGVCDPAI